MSKIAIIYGTKAEEIRLTPVINVLHENKIPILAVQTGQQELQMKENFIYSNQILARNLVDRQGLIMQRLNNLLDNESLDAVIVIGNTLSAFCGALYGFLRGIRIIHINAGQRTYDLHNAFPEEGFGQLITKLTDIHLVTTKFTYKNLIKEGINKNNVFIVGNTLSDVINSLKISNKTDTDNVLIAVKRKENIKNLKCICMVANNLSQKYQDHIFNILLPDDIDMQKEMSQYILKNTNVNILEDLSHKETLTLINKSILILTDSFSIQEEATILKKPTFILRKCIENIESLKTGAARLIEVDYYKLLEKVDKFLNGKIKFRIKDCKYYKNDASKNIYAIIDKFYTKD